MNSETDRSSSALPAPIAARNWVGILSEYREASDARSVFELASTIIPFIALWGIAYWIYPVSVWFALVCSVANAGFLVRLFAIQHDCGHGAFFARRSANDWLGRILGVLTLTPYSLWRHSHSIHHSTSGNLDRRGIGDIYTMTVREYDVLPMRKKICYHIYRHPITLFFIIPVGLYFFHNRIPVGFMRSGPKLWLSAMGTNAALALLIGTAIYSAGLGLVITIYLPTVIVAATVGVWLFYVQHQFEETSWEDGFNWQIHDAALHGSSHYDLPVVLRWLTANIGIHHVHHLHSRIPFYRLPAVLRDHPDLANVTRITLLSSLSCIRLRLWDEKRRKLVTFAEARQLT